MSDFTFEWRGEAATREMVDAGTNALLEGALIVQEESAEEAPVDKGDLKGNASVDDSKLQSEGKVLVDYNLPYAMDQHEGQEYNHPQGGKAKFLEDPFERLKPRIIDHVADAIDEAAR